jgi:HNH endonuclease
MPCSVSGSQSWPSTTRGATVRRLGFDCPPWWHCAKYQRSARRVAFTRFNVFLCDRFFCQYCGEAFASSALTFEHVIPRSRSGQTMWSNIVTACVPYNTRKAGSTRFKPRRPPKQPTLNELLAAKRAPGYLHESWTDYLYWDAQLEA